jgi:hypothetical protein
MMGNVLDDDFKKNILLFVPLIGIMSFFSSCKQEKKEECHEIYFRRYVYNNDIPEQGEEPLECRIDTVEYVIEKSLGKYNYDRDDWEVFSDSILSLWNQVSMKNIKKNDPKLLNDRNYVWYQILEIGDNKRLAFWRMVNKFYTSYYDFDEGFYVIETENRSADPIYYASYLISPKSRNKHSALQFGFGGWNNSESIAYLTDIKEIDCNIFNSYYTELKKQNVHDELLWGFSECTISYFHKDTIESYVNIDYGNFEIIAKMKDLLDGN